MAGTTMIDYVTFRTFLDKAGSNYRTSPGLLPMMAQYGTFVRAGGAVLLISGAVMLMLSPGVWQQGWFRVKIALVVLLILNGTVVGNRNGVAFRKMAVENTSDFLQRSADIGATLNRFYITQLGLFFLIILISAVKFDRNTNG